MHEREIKSRRYSLVCLIASIVIFGMGAGLMLIYILNNGSALSVIALPIFIIPCFYFFVFAIKLSAVSLKLASLAVRECMHDVPCSYSKNLKTAALITLVSISVLGIAILIGGLL